MLISAKVLLPHEGKVQKGKVIGRSYNDDGNLLGEYNTNPLLNSIIYNVEFPDRQLREYSASTIAQIIYTKVDKYGHSHTIFQ